MPRDVESLRDVLAVQRPALPRTALLLAGDRTSAKDLVHEALSRTVRRRSWRPRGPALEPALEVRAAMVWLHGRRARGPGAEQVVDPRVRGGGGRLCRGAPRPAAPDRAVVVLRRYEHRPGAEVAAVLGIPAEDVVAEERRADAGRCRGGGRPRRSRPAGGGGRGHRRADGAVRGLRRRRRPLTSGPASEAPGCADGGPSLEA